MKAAAHSCHRYRSSVSRCVAQPYAKCAPHTSIARHPGSIRGITLVFQSRGVGQSYGGYRVGRGESSRGDRWRIGDRRSLREVLSVARLARGHQLFHDAERQSAEALLVDRVGIVVQGDVSSDADCRRIAQQALDAFGRIDALVSSAGTTRMVPHADLDGLTIDDFIRTATVNTAGPFLISRACAPALAAGDGGSIVIISSYGAIYGTGSSIAYAASKGATNTLTMSLARVLAPKVRVNAVCPALVSDGFIERLDPELFRSRAAHQIDRSPLRKVGTPAEVAADIYWLTAGAAMITGSVLSLDCGLHLNGDG
jgi:3-oxoacyl-[acyl-carrier protein] reductase